MKTSKASANAIEDKMNEKKKPSKLKPRSKNGNESSPMRKEGKAKTAFKKLPHWLKSYFIQVMF